MAVSVKDNHFIRPVSQFLNSESIVNQRHSSSTSLFNACFPRTIKNPSATLKSIKQGYHVDYSTRSSSSNDTLEIDTASKLYKHRRKNTGIVRDVQCKSSHRKVGPKTESQIKSNVNDWLERNDKECKEIEKNVFIDYEAMEKGNSSMKLPRKKSSLTKVNKRLSKETLRSDDDSGTKINVKNKIESITPRNALISGI